MIHFFENSGRRSAQEPAQLPGESGKVLQTQLFPPDGGGQTAGGDGLNQLFLGEAVPKSGGQTVDQGLAAEGETKVYELRHIFRGYEHIVDKLKALGADIERIAVDNND